MIVWILYDIKNNKSRTKVSKLCKQAGLYRVQYSVFLGTISSQEKEALSLQIEELIDEETDKAYIFPMNKNELQQTELLGQAFDKKLVTDEVKAMFF
ncbi:CRISPR-associated endonuclease Cas2 [Litoribacter populi]|uniref:CRISPR-associated endonuclease Cas2 n=1 Tax=Litoribacter populi TaxID=2598460 RepID=UPI00117F6EDE|nr:CRISPR-associated endonuclease Cas2 [Litoribacter populi]